MARKFKEIKLYFLVKLTANASQNLVIKLMSDAKRRNYEKEKKMKEKNERELKHVRYFY